MHTGKDSSFTIERLVKIVLIARVSSNKYGVGAILRRIVSGVLRPFVVFFFFFFFFFFCKSLCSDKRYTGHAQLA